MATLTTNEYPEQIQRKDSMIYVAFEKDENATQHWYSGLYKRAVSWLQNKPMVYSHVFILMYVAESNTWYMAECKYIMGERDNGVIVGTLTDEVVTIPRDEHNEYTICLINGNETLLYDAVRLPCDGDVDILKTMLIADSTTLVKPPTALDFLRVFMYGNCESYLCTDFVTTALDIPIDFITTPDMLHELLLALY